MLNLTSEVIMQNANQYQLWQIINHPSITDINTAYQAMLE